MPSNLTVDDTNPSIVYSENWATQNPADPDLSEFFSKTYHTALADGASANISFTGSAVYIYGSTGPAHANYTVQFDAFIVGLSASRPTTSYQQPLFFHTFDTVAQHFVSIVAHPVPGGSWLDVDFITVTTADSTNSTASNSATATGGANNVGTITPPWATANGAQISGASLPPASPSSQTSAGSSSKDSNSALSKTTLTLSIVFGAIIGIVLIVITILVCLQRRQAKLSRREASFRYGQKQAGYSHQVLDARSPPAPSSISPSSVDIDYNAAPVLPAQGHHHLQGHLRGNSTFSPEVYTDKPRDREPAWPRGVFHTRTVSPLSTATDARLLNPAASNRPLDTPSPVTIPPPRADSIAPAVPRRGPPPRRPQRPGDGILDWLGSGMGWDTRGVHKGDGNSMKTDFLQV